MKNPIKFLGLGALALLGSIALASAQNTTYLSVASCGNQTYLAGRPAPPTVDLTGQNCISGTINASTSAKATAAAPSYIEGSTNPLSMDLSGALRVAGSLSLAGSTSNATSGVVTSSTNLPTVNYNYGFNGTTWDQLQVDGSKFLKVITQTGSTSAVTQATAASLNATVVGTGTFATQAAQSGTWNITNISGTITLPTLAATSTKQSDGSQKTQIVDGAGNVIASTSNNLNVQCANCSGAGVSAADEAAFTAGSSLFAPAGGFYQTTATSNALTNGQQGFFQVTANRALFVNLRNASGAELGVAAAPVQVSLANTAANGTAVSVSLAANQSVNVAQINGVTPLMGNGVTGTGSQRVTIASDNTAFAVNATLSAETTKVIGTVNQGTSPWIVAGGGTAGSAASGVVTIQGIASMTKLLVTPDANSAVNVAQINGVTVLMGNGVTGTGSQRVTIASDNTSNSNPWLINGNVTPADALALGTTSNSTVARSSVYNGTTTDLAREVANSTNSTGTGIAAAGLLAQCDDTSPTAITENSFGNARMDCASHAQLVTTVPSATAGGTTLYTLTLANSTNATNVKASAGQVYSISGFNMSSATPVWISLYNNSGTPSCGTSIIQQFMIPGNTTGAGFVYDFATPKGFATGIAFCATTGIAGTGSVAASTYVLNIDYK